MVKHISIGDELHQVVGSHTQFIRKLTDEEMNRMRSELRRTIKLAIRGDELHQVVGSHPMKFGGIIEQTEFIRKLTHEEKSSGSKQWDLVNLANNYTNTSEI